MDDVRRQGEGDYDAFVSYNHADREIAQALQRALHGFARPWNRRRALSLFLDTSALAASPALWPSVLDGLTRSRHLILLASPEAAASVWVDRELEHWLAARGTDSILLVVVRGGWDWDSGAAAFTSTASAVPPRLRTAYTEEPRHVDLRHLDRPDQWTLRAGEFRSAVAELAAPLHGVAKEDLESEDLRQFRRFRTIRNTSVAALCLLAVLTISAAADARSQREEAERRTAEAKDQQALAVSRNLVVHSKELALTDAALSRQLAVAAWRVKPIPEARARLTETLNNPLVQSNRPWLSGAALGPGNDLVVHTAEDGKLVLRHITSGRIARTIPGTCGGTISTSPDGRWAAVWNSFVLEVWDLREGTLVRSFAMDDVAAAELGPDGAVLTVRYHFLDVDPTPTTVDAWDVRSGKRVWGPVTKEDDQFLQVLERGRVVLSRGGTLEVWDPQRNRRLASLPAARWVGDLDQTRSQAVLSPDDRQLLVSTGVDELGDRLQLLLSWNLRTRTAAEPRLISEPDRLAYDASGRRLAVTHVHGVEVWDTASMTAIGHPLPPDMGDAWFDRSGDLLLGNDSIWSLSAFRRILPERALAEAVAPSAAFSPDDATIAVNDVDDRVRVHRVSDGRLVHEFPKTPGPDGTFDASWDRHGRRVLLAGTRSSIVDVVAKTRRVALPGIRTDSLTRLSPDGRTAAVLTRDRGAAFVEIRRIGDGGLVWRIPDRHVLDIAGETDVQAITFAPDSRRVAVVTTERISLWDLGARGKIRTIDGGPVTSMTFSGDGTVFAVTGDRRVDLYDAGTGVRTSRVPSVHAGDVTLGIDGRTIAMDENEGIRLVEVSSRATIGELDLAGSSSGAGLVAANASDKLAIGYSDGSIQLWDLDGNHIADGICRESPLRLTSELWRQFVPELPFREICP